MVHLQHGQSLKKYLGLAKKLLNKPLDFYVLEMRKIRSIKVQSIQKVIL
jgi:hypothetical protein